MRAVIQRVSRAKVTVGREQTGAIDKGLLILLGVKTGDTGQDAEWVAEKCVNLRIFEDSNGKFEHSLIDTGGSVLVVSQFTLYGNCRKGRRPSFSSAAGPGQAEALYETFVACLRQRGVDVQTGVFGAHMHVELVNDGPVTLIVDKNGSEE